MGRPKGSKNRPKVVLPPDPAEPPPLLRRAIHVDRRFNDITKWFSEHKIEYELRATEDSKSSRVIVTDSLSATMANVLFAEIITKIEPCE